MRRTLSSIVLLMVMVLQMGVRTLHQHHSAGHAEIVCSDCEHHKVHDGHLLSWDGVGDDCPMCQQLTTPFTNSSVRQAEFLLLSRPIVYVSRAFVVGGGCRGAHHLRGPPCFLC